MNRTLSTRDLHKICMRVLDRGAQGLVREAAIELFGEVIGKNNLGAIKVQGRGEVIMGLVFQG